MEKKKRLLGEDGSRNWNSASSSQEHLEQPAAGSGKNQGASALQKWEEKNSYCFK